MFMSFWNRAWKLGQQSDVIVRCGPGRIVKSQVQSPCGEPINVILSLEKRPREHCYPLCCGDMARRLQWVWKWPSVDLSRHLSWHPDFGLPEFPGFLNCMIYITVLQWQTLSVGFLKWKYTCTMRHLWAVCNDTWMSALWEQSPLWKEGKDQCPHGPVEV